MGSIQISIIPINRFKEHKCDKGPRLTTCCALLFQFHSSQSSTIRHIYHPESKDFDLLRYWQVRYPNDLYYSYSSYSQSRLSIRCCGKWRWTFCLLRHQLCLVNEFSHQVKRRTHFDVQICHRGRWKSSNSSNSATDLTASPSLNTWSAQKGNCQFLICPFLSSTI